MIGFRLIFWFCLNSFLTPYCCMLRPLLHLHKLDWPGSLVWLCSYCTSMIGFGLRFCIFSNIISWIIINVCSNILFHHMLLFHTKIAINCTGFFHSGNIRVFNFPAIIVICSCSFILLVNCNLWRALYWMLCILYEAWQEIGYIWCHNSPGSVKLFFDQIN